MSPQDFTYWLQGFFEISNSDCVSETQVKIIKDHLNLVFKKETPTYFSGVLPPQNLPGIAPLKFSSIPQNIQSPYTC